MAPSLNLSDDQRFALMKFRRNVSDCTRPNNDIYLLRWLRARHFKIDEAEKMLRASLEWRIKWDLDNLKNWNPPEVLSQYYPVTRIGFDKEGSPLAIMPFAGLDMYGMMHCVTKEEFIKYTIKLVEEHLDLGLQQAETHGQAAAKVVLFIDMDNFSLKQYAWRPAGETIIALLQMYEANYPEILKLCLIVNAPKVFSIAFSIVKTFFNEDTISKIQVYDKNPRKWQPKLFGMVDYELIPAFYGGTDTGPDGDPKCTSKIKQGGKIPKKYYLKKMGGKASAAVAAPDETEMKSVTIKKGDKLILPVYIPTVGSFIRWEFRTVDHDIKFGVECFEDSGVKATPIQIHRVNCHQSDEIGVLQCQTPCTYNLIFDNSYSLLRNKKMQYAIYVTPPAQENGSLCQES